MRTITKKVYKYDELSEEAKEKVRNYFGQYHTDIETDNLEQDFKYQIEEEYPFFINPKFQWSLSCCQGDGLSFSCDIDLNKYLDIYYPKIKTSVYDALCNAVYNLHSKGNTGYYCYCSKSDIGYDYNYQDGVERKRLYTLLEKIVEEIREVYIKVCENFEKQGYNAYEYLYTDEYAKNICEANDYEFYEDGEMF